jgi:hypothetical protein
LRVEETVSPKLLQKVVYAGVNTSSFGKASEALQELAEADVSDQRVRRATEKIGDERVAQREAEVQQFQELPLPQRRQSPVDTVPQVAVIEMDGGRLQYRDRLEPEAAPEVHQEDGRKGRFWRETKVGVLLTMASTVSQQDPCPIIPECFVDPARMPQVFREIKGTITADKPPAPPAETAAESAKDAEQKSSERPSRPVPLVRSVVATRQKLDAFGWMLASAAYARGFVAAKRKAFVGDGLEQNWTIWQRHFSDYVAILDLMHALCYVYAAAMADRTCAEGWPIYCQWAQWVWEGRVDLVIAGLRERQQVLGLPEADEKSPRQVVADGLRYLQNQSSRMKYPEYRRLGLPLTSCHVESLIKQINKRLKGTEKFWSEGAEPMLQLLADYLSETRPLDRFWHNRQHTATGQRPYATAV